jgi:hypothetical protein
MSRPLPAVVTELNEALAELLDNVIASQVCEQDDWRQQSFVDALRDYRHLRNLTDELKRMASRADGGGA